ncbi:hypothetical protein B296_00008051 [Ensete ventricosum]|uniref:Uncharacterized protein n=1 Tax=Ensete ventricosum TaxID=4639 RepID=A0A427ALV5_ENSVE|nr:hypothetical protein B296_00008051 [Ensete ventricosum]
MGVRRCRGGVGNWKLVTAGAGILVKEEAGAHQTHHLTHPLIIVLLLIVPLAACVAEKEKEKLLPSRSQGHKCVQGERVDDTE